MAREAMDEIDDVRCYEYAGEVVVELFGSDAEGDVAVVSYGFRRDGDDGAGELRGPEVDPEHADRVRRALRDAGYAVDV
ncbi:MAG: hypothetical protein ABEH40_01135 [Haloferacaceae archaeon]